MLKTPFSVQSEQICEQLWHLQFEGKISHYLITTIMSVNVNIFGVFQENLIFLVFSWISKRGVIHSRIVRFYWFFFKMFRKCQGLFFLFFEYHFFKNKGWKYQNSDFIGGHLGFLKIPQGCQLGIIRTFNMHLW